MAGLDDAKSVGNYSLIAKLFHWGIAAIFVYGIVKQVNDISQLEDTALLIFEVVFATVFVALLVTRLIYVKKTQKSSLPASTPVWQKWAAKVVHAGMYISLGSIAVSGLLIGMLFWLGQKSGLMVDLVVGLHELSVTLSYWLVIMHIVAAVYHRFLKDGVWSSMVPVWKE